MKLFFAEPTARRVGVKPEPIEEPVLLRCDDNHSPNAAMMRAVIVNNLDSLINLESGGFRPPDIWIAWCPRQASIVHGAVALSEGVSELAFNPLALSLGGRVEDLGDTPDPGSVPLHHHGESL